MAPRVEDGQSRKGTYNAESIVADTAADYAPREADPSRE